MSENLPPVPEGTVPNPQPVVDPPAGAGQYKADPGFAPPPPAGQYGQPGIPPPSPGPIGVTEDDKLWAAIAHLGIIAGLFLGPGAILIPILIFFLKDRPFVKFHAAQAGAYQIATGIILTALWIVGGILLFILIGFLFWLAAVVLGIAAFIYGIIAGVKVKNGENFRYPYLAELVEKHLNVRAF